jgi:CRISPR-associated protein Csd1
MLLQRLLEIQDVSVPPQGYKALKVDYILRIDNKGRLLGTDLTPLGHTHIVPTRGRNHPGKPILCVDYSRYILGKDTTRTSEECSISFESHRDLVRQCAEQTQVPEMLAVKGFFDSDQVQSIPEPDKDGLIAVYVRETMVASLPAVQRFWSNYSAESIWGDLPIMQCLGCGEEKPILLTSGKGGGKLQRLGSQGVMFASFDKGAFHSYGLNEGRNAPLCLDCSTKALTAFQMLIDSKIHRYFLSTPRPPKPKEDKEDDTPKEREEYKGSGIRLLYWLKNTITDENTDDDDMFASVCDGNESHVQQIRSQGFTSKGAIAIDEMLFHCAVVSANSSRLVLHDFMDISLGELSKNFARWYDQQCLAGQNGPYTGLNHLALAFVYQESKKKQRNAPVSTYRVLYRAAMLGKLLPTTMVNRYLHRLHTNGGISHHPGIAQCQVALMYLLLNKKKGLDYIMTEEEVKSSVGYQLGRLFNVLEQAQKALNLSGFEKLRGQAARSPARTFSRIFGKHYHHIKRVNAVRPGTAIALGKKRDAIMGRIQDIPTELPHHEQALFYLGLHHAAAEDAKAAEEYKSRKERDAGEQQLLLDSGIHVGIEETMEGDETV